MSDPAHRPVSQKPLISMDTRAAGQQALRPARAPSTPFRSVLEGTPRAAPTRENGGPVRAFARQLAEADRTVDQQLARVRRGAALDSAELLAFQVQLYRVTQQIDLGSKLVDKATGAVRQTLQSQQ